MVLNKTEYLNKILEGFYDKNIRGATIIDSTGMGQTLSCKMPVFGGIRHLFEDCRPHNLTIFSVLDDEHVRIAKEVVKEVLGNIDEPGTGIMFALPLDFVSGLS